MARLYSQYIGYSQSGEQERSSRGSFDDEGRNVDRYRDAESRDPRNDDWSTNRQMQSNYPNEYPLEWGSARDASDYDEERDESAWRRESSDRDRDIYEQQRLRRNEPDDYTAHRYGEQRGSSREESRRRRYPEEASTDSNRMFGEHNQFHQGNHNYGASKYGGSEYERTDFDRYSAERSNYGGPYSEQPSRTRRALDSWRHGSSSDWYSQPRALGNEPRSTFRGFGPKGYVRSDERMKETICERLTEAPHIDASEISIEVKNQEVTLTGAVPDRRTKFAAEELVGSCGGVTEIHNQLRIASSTQGEHQSNVQRSATSSQS